VRETLDDAGNLVTTDRRASSRRLPLYRHSARFVILIFVRVWRFSFGVSGFAPSLAHESSCFSLRPILAGSHLSPVR